MLIKCDMCKKIIDTDKARPDGTPNGVGFEFEDGTMLNVCSECICKVGENADEFGKFLERWKKDVC